MKADLLRSLVAVQLADWSNPSQYLPGLAGLVIGETTLLLLGATVLVGARQAALALVAGLQPEEGNLVSGFEGRVGKGRIFLKVVEFGQGKDGQLLGLVVPPVVLLVELGFEAADLQLRALVVKRKALHPLLLKLYNPSIAHRISGFSGPAIFTALSESRFHRTAATSAALNS